MATSDSGGPARYRSSEARFVRVLIVEDHDLFRTGLAAYLASQSDIEVIGQVHGGRAGVRLAAELEPDVVVMDVLLHDMHGIDAIEEISSQRSQPRVVVLTIATDERSIADALSAGARGFVVKDSPLEDVAAAVRAAGAWAAWLSPPAVEVVLAQLRREQSRELSDADGLQELSARELDVLRLLARGLENAQIAEVLDISPSTAKNHVSSILTKLGLANRIQAALYAVRNELP